MRPMFVVILAEVRHEIIEMPLAEHEEEGLESDVDADVDEEENRDPTQRLSLPSRTPFPKR